MTVKELKKLLQYVEDDYEARLEFINGYDADDCAEWNNTTFRVEFSHEYKEVYFIPED